MNYKCKDLRGEYPVDTLPTLQEINTMPQKELLYTYHSYLDNINMLCRRKLRMGNTGDGGWEVCDDYEYRPMQPCIVYSFGINNDFSFDDDVGRLYGCHVYAFDPSMKQASHNRSKEVHFFRIGLGGKNGRLPRTNAKWHVESLSGIRKMLKHEQVMIDIVKMDIESSEWLTLPDMIETGALNLVRQFMVEFHRPQSDPKLRERLYTLKKLESLGFQRFHTHMNYHCTDLLHEYPSPQTEDIAISVELVADSKIKVTEIFLQSCKHAIM
ncbi:putative methyltransferase-like protein 24 [Babylonia areolata]|uniref:putative methyltransferase-like protein 24 n=1 Tax=Babylonia areolata TaxID=304850 RepID=UPI003FCF4E2F